MAALSPAEAAFLALLPSFTVPTLSILSFACSLPVTGSKPHLISRLEGRMYNPTELCGLRVLAGLDPLPPAGLSLLAHQRAWERLKTRQAPRGAGSAEAEGEPEAPSRSLQPPAAPPPPSALPTLEARAGAVTAAVTASPGAAPRGCPCSAPIHAGAAIVRCASLDCPAPRVWHAACAGLSPAAAQQPLDRRWRCVVCRFRAMCPAAAPVAVLGDATLVWPPGARCSPLLGAGAPFVATLRFFAPLPSASHPHDRIQVVCVRADPERDDDATVCAYPAPPDVTLAIGAHRVVVPRAAPGARSAPLLDISGLVARGEANTLKLVVPASAVSRLEPAPYVLLVARVRPMDDPVADTVRTIITERVLHGSLASLACFEAEWGVAAAHMGGRLWRGVAAVDLSTVARAWERSYISNGRSAPGAAALNLNDCAIALPPPEVVGGDVGALTSAGAGGVDDDDEGVQVEAVTRVSLRDVLSLQPLSIPVRGDTCDHTQCFDLASYLASNTESPSPRWKCPICSRLLMPAHLWLDPVALRVLRATGAGEEGGRLDGEAQPFDADGKAGERYGPLSMRAMPQAASACLVQQSRRVVELRPSHCTWQLLPVDRGDAGPSAAAVAAVTDAPYYETSEEEGEKPPWQRTAGGSAPHAWGGCAPHAGAVAADGGGEDRGGAPAKRPRLEPIAAVDVDLTAEDELCISPSSGGVGASPPVAQAIATAVPVVPRAGSLLRFLIAPPNRSSE